MPSTGRAGGAAQGERPAGPAGRPLEATLEQSSRSGTPTPACSTGSRGELETERAPSHELLLQRPAAADHRPAERGRAAHRRPLRRRGRSCSATSSGSPRSPAACRSATLVSSLNALFSAFDAACAALGVEKIKTIGDAYMAAAGLPGTSDRAASRRRPTSRSRCARRSRRRAALAGPDRPAPRTGRRRRHRHARKFVYDLWGDAVNVASRLETTAPPGRIQVSGPSRTALGDAFEFEPRGQIELKGKGSTEAYELVARR